MTAGRQYSVNNDLTCAFASGADWAASGLSYGTRAADVDNVDTTNRIQNTIKYETPVFGGLQFGALYSLGGQAGSMAKNEVIDASASYTNGPVKIGAGYTVVKDPYYATYGDQGNSSATATGTNDNVNNKIYGGYASAGFQQIMVAGASCAFGPATIGVLYSNTQFGSLGTVAAGGAISAPKYSSGTATFNSGEVNVKYQLTPPVLLAGAYIYTHNSGADSYDSARYTQANLGVIYSLSKRTSLYAIGFYEIASGTDSTGHAAVADLYGSAYSRNDRQVSGILGMTHRF